MQGLRSTLRSCWVRSHERRPAGVAGLRARKGAFSGRSHLPGQHAAPQVLGLAMGRPARFCGPLRVRWRSALQPAHVSATGQPMSSIVHGSAIVLVEGTTTGVCLREPAYDHEALLR
jgi:hypothetical protein